MTARALVWGAGAVGAPIGAALSAYGHAVTFVDADKQHVAAMRDPRVGLIVEGGGIVFRGTVDACLPLEVAGVWDIVFLCVKAQHTGEAARQIASHLAPDGVVVCLQNGLTEFVAADVLGAGRVIGGFVNFGADIVAPGSIRFGNHGAIRVGEIDRMVRPRTEEVASLLRCFDPEAQSTDDIWSYLWGKLGYAALLYAQATGEAGIVECLARPELLPLWRALAGEIVAVAQAEGISPRGFNGFEPAAFSPGASADQAARSVARMVEFNAASDKTHSGVWRDLAVRRRPTEVDAHYGPVIAAAKRHRLACPVLSRLIAAIHAIERGIPQDDRNLLALLEPAYG